MSSKDGATYQQNDDLIVKWLAEALHGETLAVLGVPTGRIEEVFGFEPVELPVQAGRVDVIVRDETGALYHIEEQRNLQRTDLYRFASYHFRGARKWPALTDIILASGEVYAGDKVIETHSGKYAPLVIDFSARNGRRRLAEIREAVRNQTFQNWLELVFLPLYGKETGDARSAMVEEVLRFESELYHAEKIPVRLLVATLILSNKFIAKERLYDLWEEIKMLDILEVAREKGIEEGKTLGLQEGKTLGMQEGKTLGVQEGKTLGVLEASREMVVEALIERFSIVSSPVSERIRSLQNPDVLKSLFHQVFRCQSLQEFEAILQQVT